MVVMAVVVVAVAVAVVVVVVVAAVVVVPFPGSVEKGSSVEILCTTHCAQRICI